MASRKRGEAACRCMGARGVRDIFSHSQVRKLIAGIFGTKARVCNQHSQGVAGVRRLAPSSWLTFRLTLEDATDDITRNLMTAKPPNGHMPQLDGLRAIAVAAVAWFHWLPGLTFGFDLGAMGVNLFFVLSGFLITGILLDSRAQVGASRERWHMLRQFFIRRFLRIFPLFYATIAILALLNIRPVRATILWHITYLSNVYFFQHGSWGREFASVSHFWSLAVEEQFYLVWPFLILFLPVRWIPKAIAAAVLLAPCYRITMAIVMPQNALSPILPIGCLDALGIGALFAYVKRSGPGTEGFRTISRSLLTVGLPAYVVFEILVHASPHSKILAAFRQTAYVLVFGWLTAEASLGFPGLPGRLLSLGPVIYIGRISYGIYILHNLAIYAVVFAVRSLHAPSTLLANPWITLAAKLGITLGLAAFSWQFFEKPINGLKRFFPYKPHTRSFGAADRTAQRS